MRRTAFLGLAIALLMAGCGGGPENPTRPSSLANPASTNAITAASESASSSRALGSEGEAVGPADGLHAAHTMSDPPMADSPQVNFEGLSQSISFEAALRAASPESSVESVTAQSRASLFTLDGGSQSALPTSAGVPDQGALVGPPALDYPTVDSARP